MERSRKVALVAHCLLNANSKARGLADYAGVHPAIFELSARGFGIVQLPCPELGVGGPLRDPQAGESYDTPAFREHCRLLAQPIVEEVREYVAAGFEVRLLVGIEGSPSCGVGFTSRTGESGESERVAGQGVWVETLREALEPFDIEFIAMDHREPDGGISRIGRG